MIKRSIFYLKTTFFLYGCAKPIFYILSYLFAPLKFLLKILISGRALAVEGEVVVVIVNFRLGAFGFLTTQDTKIPQNAAMRDQNLALQWVQRQRDKIATFVFSFVAKNSYNVSRNEYFWRIIVKRVDASKNLLTSRTRRSMENHFFKYRLNH